MATARKARNSEYSSELEEKKYSLMKKIGYDSMLSCTKKPLLKFYASWFVCFYEIRRWWDGGAVGWVMVDDGVRM